MKLLCLGNADNVGVRLYSWLCENNTNVELYRVTADEDELRGNPYLYLSKETIEKNSDIHQINDPLLKIRFISLIGGEIVQKINNTFDAVIITGGFHALLLSKHITLPKIFIPVGYEIHHHARKHRGIPDLWELLKNPRFLLRCHFYSWLTRRSLSSVEKVLDWFPPTVAVHKALGFENKIIYMAFGEDLEKNKRLVNKQLVTALNSQTKKAKKVFLWLSRLNFTDPNQANYKGADLFIKALENHIEALKTGELMVYMGKHGLEVNEFMKFVSKSPVSTYINWVNHLDYPDLLAYLSIENGVLFTDFGDVNAGISGIGRDGYTMGIPMVNSNTDEIMIKQYTVPGVRYYAKELNEIIPAMSYFLSITNVEFEKLKMDTISYGTNYIDKHFFMKRLIREIEVLTRKSVRGSSPLELSA